MEIRQVRMNEMHEALSVAWETFLEFDAGDYDEEGIREFRDSIRDPEYLGMLTVYGAFDADGMAGMLATRSKGTHLALFFVDKRRQNRGVGGKLLKKALEDLSSDEMTVNAAPYAVDIYHRLGFQDSGELQTENGITFTPMVLKKNNM